MAVGFFRLSSVGAPVPILLHGAGSVDAFSSSFGLLRVDPNASISSKSLAGRGLTEANASLWRCPYISLERSSICRTISWAILGSILTSLSRPKLILSPKRVTTSLKMSNMINASYEVRSRRRYESETGELERLARAERNTENMLFIRTG